MTQRNPTPPGMEMKDSVMLRDIMNGDISTVASIQPVESPRQPKIQDWLRKDHERNDLQRDVKQLRHDIERVELFLTVFTVSMFGVLIMLLMLWMSGL